MGKLSSPHSITTAPRPEENDCKLQGQSYQVILDLGGTAGVCSPYTLSTTGRPSAEAPSLVWSRLTPPLSLCRRGTRCCQLLTEAALSPVVVGQTVVTLGPRGSFFAFTVAGLVAAVVHGADLVAVTFWPKMRLLVPVLPRALCPLMSQGRCLGLEKSGCVLWEGC